MILQGYPDAQALLMLNSERDGKGRGGGQGVRPLAVAEWAGTPLPQRPRSGDGGGKAPQDDARGPQSA